MNKKITTQKRVRTNIRNYYHNRAYKSSIKTLMKKVKPLIATMDSKNLDDVSLHIAEAFSKIDKSIKRKIIHKNTGARKKAILSQLFNKKYAEVFFNLS